MYLRPIDVILFHPEKYFYVVYQNGQLFRLARKKLDMTSWERRQPYTGNRDALVVSSTQTVLDKPLSKLLNTQELPANLHGRSLAVFKGWWMTNGYQWLQEHRPASNSAKDLNSLAPTSPINTANDQTSPMPMSNNVADNNTAAINTAANNIDNRSINNNTDIVTDIDDTTANVSHVKPDPNLTRNVSDDFFDNLLNELNH